MCGVLVLSAAMVLGVGPLAGASSGPAPGGETTWYAYAGASENAALADCVSTDDTAQQCTLDEALSFAVAGGTVYLATPGTSSPTSYYIGNWTVSTWGTSASSPVTIEPAPGVTGPILDGDGTGVGTCSTPSCNGPVLTVGENVYLDIDGITVQDANNTTWPYSGGAIDNEDGTLTVSGSTFSGNTAAYDGGAIDNGDAGGDGTLTVSGSTFSGNTAANDGYGGAIDNGSGGTGTLTVSGSTFSANTADAGGAIASGDGGGHGTLTVSGSTFSGNTARYDGLGGAIDNGDTSGTGSLTVSASTFSGNTAADNGGAIDNGDNFGTGTLTVSGSTFSGNTATEEGPIIRNGSGEVWAAADIFDGSCSNWATWDDEGYNVGNDGSCLSDVNYGASLLGSLADNGGPTETMLPLAANPAVGLIPNPTSVTLNGSSVALCPTTDQRGVQSTPGASCNAGAVQGVLALPPTVSSVSPSSGPTTGGQPITITGTGFVTGATVEIGQGQGAGPTAIAATDVVVVSSTEITATTGGNAIAGTFNLFVITPAGTSATNPGDLYQYQYAGLTVSSVSPSSGPTTGGQPITITGTGFVTGATVEIGQGQGAGPTAIAATDVVVVSSTEITATTGGNAIAGTFNLFVITPAGTSATNPGDLYQYQYAGLTVSSVSPSSGPTTGGQPITITGTGFVTGATVEIGQGQGAGPTAIAATDVVVVSSTEITATTGGNAIAGTFNLFVITPAGTSATNPGDDYTY